MPSRATLPRRRKKYLENTPLATITTVRQAEFSLAELEADARNIRGLAPTVPFDLHVNVPENRVELLVASRDEFLEFRRTHDIALPPNTIVVDVPSLTVPAANIHGGLPLSDCTSGFSVRSLSGTSGIVTAGHCANTISYQGVNLPYVLGIYSGSHDEQWHTVGSHTVRHGWISDGLGGRNIIAKTYRSNQSIGAFVCKYGKTTGFGCGNIVSKTHAPSYIPNVQPTYIRVHKAGVDLASRGDSGGPVFSSNSAYGIVHGSIGSNNIDDLVYTTINYVESGLSVSITTAP